MPTITCLCSAVIEGPEAEALVGAFLVHNAAIHADLAIPEQRVRDVVAASLRMKGGTVRLPVIGTPTVRPVTPACIPDFLHFFDEDAFADNPIWADCYCVYPYFAGTDAEWEAATAAENRAAITELIGGGQARGYLAYVDGRPAGWCNAAPRPMLVNFDRQPEYAVDDRAEVGAIACFVIAPPYRRHGIARQLLDAALDGFRREGLRVAEAYPRATDDGSDGHAFHGPLAMYLAAGFTVFRALGETVMVRKATD